MDRDKRTESKAEPYVQSERRKCIDRRIFTGRRRSDEVRLNADQEERSMSEDRPDKPLKDKPILGETVEQFDKRTKESSGRQFEASQNIPDHPGYVKGAKAAYSELWREFNRLMGCVKTEIDSITWHSAVTDAMLGSPRAQCSNCLFYVQVSRCAPHCHRRAPTAQGWPVIVGQPEAVRWCGEFKPKVE